MDYEDYKKVLADNAYARALVDAYQAAECVKDAFADEEYPNAESAWEFMQSEVWMSEFPATMPDAFKAEYNRLINVE
jgi:hypothetical protein